MLRIGNRADFGFLLKSMGYNRGAEIGVQEGLFAAEIRKHWGGDLHLIDSWTMIEEFPGVSIAVQFNNYLKTVIRFLDDFHAYVHRMSSRQAAETFPDGFFDWVYIDADHRPTAIREDLRLWYPKVRNGGVLAGHDYLDGKVSAGDFGVKSAVDRLIVERGHKLIVTNEAEWPTWYFLKD